MEIVNIVASGSFNQKVNLQSLMAIGDKFTFDPQKYHGGYLKLDSGKVTLYKSGKYILTGIKSIEQVSKHWQNVILILSPYLDTSLFDAPKIQNIVLMDTLNIHLSLSKIISGLKDENAEYEPEVFPGLIWRTKYGSINLFQSGKYMMLGCKSLEDAQNLSEYVNEKLTAIMSS